MTDPILPLTQSIEFEEACKLLELPIRRFENELGSCLIQTRKLPIVGNMNLISRGPVLKDPAGLRPFVADVRSALRGRLVVNAGAGASNLGGMKFARGADLAILDIKEEDTARAALHQKWRNQLKKAEKSPLVILNQALNPHKHAWFFKQEQSQQKTRGYQNYPTHFLLAFAAANKNQARLFSAVISGKPVAAMLVFKHGRMATYQAGVNSPEGRQHCAHNLILWHIVCELRKRGVEQLDLGRADVSPGLKRFKLGVGARIETLAGSFLFPNILRRRARNAPTLGASHQEALS